MFTFGVCTCSKLQACEAERDRLRLRVEPLKSKVTELQDLLKSKDEETVRLNKKLDAVASLRGSADRREAIDRTLKEQAARSKAEAEEARAQLEKTRAEADSRVK